jgi:WD40 repeat protein
MYSFWAASSGIGGTVIQWIGSTGQSNYILPWGCIDLKVHPTNTQVLIADNRNLVHYNVNSSLTHVHSIGDITCFDISPNWEFVAIGQANGVVRVYRFDGSHKSPLPTQVFCRHRGIITSVKFAGPDIVLSGATDELMYCWDANTGKELQCCEGHDSEIRSIISTSSLGAFTVGGFADSTVRLWNMRAGAEVLRSPVIEGDIGAIALDAPKMRVYIGTKSGTLNVWNLDSNTLVLGPRLGSPVTSLIKLAKLPILVSGSVNQTEMYVIKLLDEITKAAFVIPPIQAMQAAGGVLAMAEAPVT